MGQTKTEDFIIVKHNLYDFLYFTRKHGISLDQLIEMTEEGISELKDKLEHPEQVFFLCDTEPFREKLVVSSTSIWVCGHTYFCGSFLQYKPGTGSPRSILNSYAGLLHKEVREKVYDMAKKIIKDGFYIVSDGENDG